MDRGEGGKREQRKRQNIVQRRKRQYGMKEYGEKRHKRTIYRRTKRCRVWMLGMECGEEGGGEFSSTRSI